MSQFNSSLALIEKLFKRITGRAVRISLETKKDDIPEWDSTFLIELIVELENELGISLDYEQIERMDSVASIIEIIEKK